MVTKHKETQAFWTPYVKLTSRNLLASSKETVEHEPAERVHAVSTQGSKDLVLLREKPFGHKRFSDNSV